MSRVAFALEQIKFARRYTLMLLIQTDLTDWFRVPPAGVSHIGWQVGHLAMAQYRLTLERVRGARPEDDALIAPAFLGLFSRDSVPREDASHYPPADEILTVFERVHDQVLREVAALPEVELVQPVLKPHRLVFTKGEALLWCAHHEGVHAGQIGLLRRQLGAGPVW